MQNEREAFHSINRSQMTRHHHVAKTVVLCFIFLSVTCFILFVAHAFTCTQLAKNENKHGTSVGPFIHAQPAKAQR